MTANIAPEEPKGPLPVAKSPRRQAPAPGEVSAGTTRYFLAKAASNGNIPALDRECASEGEAKIESLKTGLNYFSLIEWRATADFTGRNPQVKSEPVKR